MDFRRRSSSGWHVNSYYPRRRYPVAAIGTLGFMSGIMVGSEIGMGDQRYYYHQQGWHDVYGVWHSPGYYTPSGMYYSNPSEFGYTPGVGMPGYYHSQPNYPTYYNSHKTYDFSGCVPLLLILCLCYCCCCKRPNTQSTSTTEPLLDDRQDDRQDVPPPAEPRPQNAGACPVNGDDAQGWLQAAFAEYCDGKSGAVGEWMEQVNLNAEDRCALDPFEDRVRNAGGDAQNEIRSIATEWNINPM